MFVNILIIDLFTIFQGALINVQERDVVSIRRACVQKDGQEKTVALEIAGVVLTDNVNLDSANVKLAGKMTNAPLKQLVSASITALMKTMADA